MITEELKLLKEEFLRIKGLDYVQATRGKSAGIEKTFEDLLGKKNYQGIEIKTKQSYSRDYITLFNATPIGKKEQEINRLKNTYGYSDKDFKSIKVLNTSVQANCFNLVSERYLFKLDVDYEQEKVYLLIYDKNMSFKERKVYWTFDMLKEKLERKFQYLALVKAWPKTVDGVEYYKYYDIEFFKLKTFEEFLKLLQDGTIRVTFKIGVYKKGTKVGEMHDRGTSFEIQELDLYKLFDTIKV